MTRAASVLQSVSCLPPAMSRYARRMAGFGVSLRTCPERAGSLRVCSALAGGRASDDFDRWLMLFPSIGNYGRCPVWLCAGLLDLAAYALGKLQALFQDR